MPAGKFIPSRIRNSIEVTLVHRAKKKKKKKTVSKKNRRARIFLNSARDDNDDAAAFYEQTENRIRYTANTCADPILPIYANVQSDSSFFFYFLCARCFGYIHR